MLLRICSILTLLSLAGTWAAAHADDARWIVVPATQNPVMNQGSPLIFAWRLNTATGALEMCTYDPGGWINSVTKTPMPETLNCTPANMPQH